MSEKLPVVDYLPPAEREPDEQYGAILKQIMDEGEDIEVIQGEKARRIIGLQMRYNMSNGFPLITERDLSKLFPGAIAEHVAFLNGARTQEDLKKFGCNWWGKWLTKEQCEKFDLPEGDMGDGSYGAAWTAFPTAEGEPFNQIQEVLKQIEERPYLRTHLISPWIPQYTIQHSERKRKVVVAPCHGTIHMLTNPEKRTLSIHHFQRSGDMPVGVPFNMVQYAAFGMMAAERLNYTFKDIVYTFSDAHIYESQFGAVEELVAREPRALGTVALSATHDRIEDYRPADFTLSDYNPHPAMRIPTPV